MTTLLQTVRELARRVQNHGSRKLNEENTKATLIEPLLRALHWNVEDFDEVQREFRQKTRDKPVDYALLVLRAPQLFVEAKALGENLDDRRWSNQIMGYASVAGVQWIVLTDGNEYRIYNTHAPVDVDAKLFRRFRLSDDAELAAKTLELLRRDLIEERRIDVLWQAQFVDQQVRAAIEAFFGDDNDLVLVNHVRSRAKALTTEDIRASLRRCRVSLDFPVQHEVEVAAPATTKRRAARAPADGREATSAPRKTGARVAPRPATGTTIGHLLEAGLLHAGAELRKTYKGNQLRGRINRDGSVVVGAETFQSPSLAAAAARASVIGRDKDGRLPPTNGWTFWRTRDATGRECELDELRQAFETRAKRSNGA